MKLSLAVLVMVGLTTLASAQQAQAKLTIAISDLGCSTSQGPHTFEVQNWTFGATNSAGTPGAAGSGAGRVQITALTVNKLFDECSASLFAAVAAGKHLTSLVLTQTDPTGRTRVMTVQLGDVVVSNYRLGGADATLDPTESVSFSFGQITVINQQNNTKAGWNVITNQAM